MSKVAPPVRGGTRQRAVPRRTEPVTVLVVAGIAVGAAATLVGAAVVVGRALNEHGEPLYAGAAPLFGRWLPHVGPGTPLAVLIGLAVVIYGAGLAERLAWRRLLALGYATAVAWTFALGLVDGWERGLAGRLTGHDEYLHEVPGVHDVGAAVRGFTSRILDFQPDSWTTHVAGHPPGALLTFVGLDRLGLGGSSAAAVACVLVGASVAVSVPVALRALGSPGVARAAVPMLALFPGAVWVGASADGLFAGVVAAGVALLAVGASGPGGPARPAEPPGRHEPDGPPGLAGGRGADLAALGGGALLGVGCYLSYGLVLMALPALAVVLVRRRVRPLLIGGAGVALVVVAFTAAGFWWLDGYELVVQRYYQGIGDERPYNYWVWANLAALVLAVGPAAVAGLATVWRADRAVRYLVVAAALAVVVADLSGLSKAETERIWLPFAVWLTAGAAMLGNQRVWLAAQAVVALAVNHLVLTGW